MTVRTKKLFGPTVVGVGTVVAYTCPAGKTAVIKDLVLYNQQAAPNTVVTRLNGNGAQNVLEFDSLGANQSIAKVERFIVLGPGDSIRFQATLASVNVSGFGAELQGVAP